MIFSDGEDHGNRWDSRIQRLREEELVVHAVAIGDPDEGHPVPGGGASGPIGASRAPVMSRRSDTAMETIAEATGGTIVKLGLASVDLGKMYETKIEPLARRRRAAGPLAERTERFPLLLLGALFFLLAGCRPVNGYGSLTWLWAWNWRRPARALGAIGLVLAAAGLVTGAGEAPPQTARQRGADAVARGKAAYDGNQMEEARSAFQSAIALTPDLAVPRYNLAATLFQLRRYEEARQCYQEAREHADRPLRTKIDYALGNTALVEGDIAGAIQSYDQCLASTAAGEAMDAVRRDAAINRQFAIEKSQSLAVPQDDGSGDQPPHTAARAAERPGPSSRRRR